MQKSQNCPCYINEYGKYYCRVLHAVRDQNTEEICSICPIWQNLSMTLKPGTDPQSQWQEHEKKIRIGEEPLFPVGKIFSGSKEIHKAFEFAAMAHQGQFRKGTDIPYLIHLIRTWDYVRQMTSDEEERAAALLHDVLEDTEVSGKELMSYFGYHITMLVASESECKRKDIPADETWRLRKQETIKRLAMLAEEESELPSLHIAFADKLANLYSMAYEYRKTGDSIWNKFNQKDKKMHAWYYGEMGKIFTDVFQLKEPFLIEKYQEYYQEVFGNYEISMCR